MIAALLLFAAANVLTLAYVLRCRARNREIARAARVRRLMEVIRGR